MDLQPRDQDLLARSQRLGVLPTWWFWRDKENSRLVRWPVRIAVAVALTLAVVFDAHWIVAGLLPVVAIMLSLGLIERYVRREASQRRLEGDSTIGDPPQLSDARES